MEEREYLQRLNEFIREMNERFKTRALPALNRLNEKTTPEEKYAIYQTIHEELGFFTRRKNAIDKIIENAISKINKEMSPIKYSTAHFIKGAILRPETSKTKIKLVQVQDTLTRLTIIDNRIQNIIEILRLELNNKQNPEALTKIKTFEEAKIREIKTELERAYPQSKAANWQATLRIAIIAILASLTSLAEAAEAEIKIQLGKTSIIDQYKDSYYLLSDEERAILDQQSKEIGISNPGRFKVKDLRKLIEYKKTRPLKEIATIILPKEEISYPEAFENPAAAKLYHEIIERYHTYIIEVEDEDTMYNLIEQTSQYGKISLLIIGGHGQKKATMLTDEILLSIMIEAGFSREDLEKRIFDITDKEDIIQRQLAKCLADKAIIFSLSCKTGEGGQVEGNLATMIHQAFQRETYASQTSFSMADITLEFKGKRIKKIIIKDEKNTVVFQSQK